MKNCHQFSFKHQQNNVMLLIQQKIVATLLQLYFGSFHLMFCVLLMTLQNQTFPTKYFIHLCFFHF